MDPKDKSEQKIITDINLQSYFFEQLSVLNTHSENKVCGEIIYYSSTVLNEFSRSGKFFEEIEGKVREKILGLKYLEAANAQKEKQKIIFKDIGDTTLFLCGYFSRSINKKILNVDYYQNLGKMSYLRLNSIVPSCLGIPSFYKSISESMERIIGLIALVSQSLPNGEKPWDPSLELGFEDPHSKRKKNNKQ